jgi:hypothetical protein
LTAGDSTLYFAAGTQYQEAPVILFNSGGMPVGTGYAEGTLYADIAVVQSAALHIAGLPDTPAVFTPPLPSPALKLASLAFLATGDNGKKLAAELAQCKSDTDGTSADSEIQLLGRYPQ